MLSFKEFLNEESISKETIKKLSKGTGSVRRKQWDEFIKTGNWAGTPIGPSHKCEHFCPTEETITKRKSGTGEPYQITQQHGTWTHMVPDSLKCHLPKEHACGDCLMIPDTVGKISMK